MMAKCSFGLAISALCLVAGGGISCAQQAGQTPPLVQSAGEPGTSQPAPSGSLLPAPVSSRVPVDTAGTPKFYTITASLREEYDDNVFTTKDNKTGSFVTEFSPSVLVDLPMGDSVFSARYTFGLDYYENRPGSSVDYTHEGLFRYYHSFSDRFHLDLRDQVGYYEEPDLLNGVGTPFRSGAYYTNTASLLFDAQWTPVFGTSTSYSNICIFYTDDTFALLQNNDENTVAQDFRFAVLPKFNLVVGGIFDEIDYFSISRGYTDYTGDIGLDWQALPELSFGFRVGGTVTVPDGLSTSLSPYAAVTMNWRLGKRSNLSFNYTHDVVPTDVVNAVGQEANRFTLRLGYDVTTRITVHVEGIETYSDYNTSLIQGGAVPSFTENDYGIDLGAQYRLTDNFSFEGGYLLSGVSSQENNRDYTRNQVYLGVRGTY